MLRYQQNEGPLIKINLIGVILVMTEIVFLVIMAILFVRVGEDQYVDGKVGVDGLEWQLSGVSENSLKTMDALLYDAISSNSQSFQNISSRGAIIRSNSLIDMRLDFADESVRYLSFMVDIPDIKQSYRAYYGYIEPEYSDEYLNNVIGIGMLCPSSDEMIYDDFGCSESIGGVNRNDIVAKYLKYSGFDEFIAYVDPEDAEKKHIKIVAKKYDYTDSEGEKYLQETKEFVESLGVSPELFEYTVEPVSFGESDESVYTY